MLKIHDFARLGEVSTTTLRYYDEIGLLIPASVDPQTGYRFYTINQLSHLHRILALKELGLGLAQITQILHEEVSPEELQGMLRLKQAELQQRIRAEQEQLTRLEARLNYFEQGGSMPTYEVVLKAVKPLTAISQPFSRADLAHKGHSATVSALRVASCRGNGKYLASWQPSDDTQGSASARGLDGNQCIHHRRTPTRRLPPLGR